jgi:putative tryptophan/tyrosine transport system substrate-binding protein
MRRRVFIFLIAGAAAWQVPARAQQAARLPTIGVLGGDQSVWIPYNAAFTARLRELGWIEGRNITIEHRWSEGRPERIAEIAAEFVRQKVDIIVTTGTAVAIIMQATTSIPIVFATATDPIGSSLVKSLARPGGNVTGLSLQNADTAGKRLDFLRLVLTDLHRLAIIFDTNYAGAVLENRNVQSAASALGLEVVSQGIGRPEDIEQVFDSLKDQADTLYVVEDSLLSSNVRRIATLALSARLPMIARGRAAVEAGGLTRQEPQIAFSKSTKTASGSP